MVGRCKLCKEFLFGRDEEELGEKFTEHNEIHHRNELRNGKGLVMEFVGKEGATLKYKGLPRRKKTVVQPQIE